MAYFFSYCVPSGIPVPPTSRVAALNSTATYHCVVSGYTQYTYVYWRIDGLQHSNPAVEARGILVITNPDAIAGTRNSTLTVPGTLENNETVILCVVVGNNGLEESPEVTLLIQGKFNSDIALGANQRRLKVSLDTIVCFINYCISGVTLLCSSP